MNAICTGPDLVLLRRDERGRLLRQVKRAEYSCFVRAGALKEEQLRALRASKHVVAIREEGAYLRILWADSDARRNACLRTVKHVDPWTRRVDEKPGLFAQWAIEVFEGDVSPERRWLTDSPDVSIARPRRVFLDFEWDSRVPFTRLAEARILVWALATSPTETKTGVLADDTETAERDLLKELWRELDGFDQVVAWNGDHADFPLLEARCERLRLAVDNRRWLWLDHLELFDRMNMSASDSGDEKQSLALDRVAQAVLGGGGALEGAGLGERKKDAFDSSKTWEAWVEGGAARDRLVAYCAKDAALMPAIEAKTGYIELLQTVCESTTVFPDTFGINPTQQVEGFLMRLGAARGIRFPTLQPLAKKFDAEDDDAPKKKKDAFKGAFNLEPQEKGIVRDVHVADFSRLYPSVILSWNMSLETHRPDVRVIESAESRPTYLSHLPLKRFPLPPGHCVAPLTDQVFVNEPQGVLPAALEEMLRLRKEWDARKTAEAPGTEAWKEADRRSAAYKIAANSFYGVVGSPFSRFFVRAVAESVAQGGVWLIKSVLAEAQKRGLRVVYAATDSAFVRGCTRAEFESFVAWCNAELFPKLLVEKGCARNTVKLAYEKQFERIVFVSKGRYCNPPETPMLMADLTFKPLGEVGVGDEVVGWSNTLRAKGRKRLAPSKVVAVHKHLASLVKLTMESGNVIRCTADHEWLRARIIETTRGEKVYRYKWTKPKVGSRLVRVLDVPRLLTPSEQFDAAWLGGIFDGEGCVEKTGRGQIVISQSRRVNPEVCAKIEEVLKRLGFRYAIRADHPRLDDGCSRYALLANGQGREGLQYKIDFVSWCRPVKRGRLVPGIMKSRFGREDAIVAIEADGYGEVIGLTTETGNYVAWGYASKNCGKYSHYKGTAATEDSKPEIKGLEYKRGDSTKLARRLQAEVVDLLMDGYEDPVTFVEVLDRFKDRVLNGIIPVQLDPSEFVLAKRLGKALREYRVKLKKDGKPAAQPAHVVVGKLLLSRGRDVSLGVRIEYVVTDATTSPMAVIPLEDFKGELDRHYLWEDLAFPPTQRLLEAAFPGQDWKPYGRTRPPKPRAVRVKPEPSPAKAKKAATDEQHQGRLFE